MMLSEFQKRKLSLGFYKFDLSKDGYVEAADFKRYGQKVAELQDIEPGSEVYDNILKAYHTVWQAYFKPADSDNDDRVTVEEYILACTYWLQQEDADEQSQEIDDLLYDTIDLNGNEKIDFSEFSVFLQATGISRDVAKETFEHLDRDGDGYISREEFTTNIHDFFTSNDPGAPGNWFFGPY